MTARSKASRIALAAVLLLTGGSALPQTPEIVIKNPGPGPLPYVIDQSGVVARTASGVCVRTGFWSPELAAKFAAAGCACDKDLLPKEVCEPPAPKAEPAPAPKAEPAPPPPPPAPKVITLSTKSLFDFNKATLTPAGRQAIDAEVLAKIGEIAKISPVIVSGHTDRLGSAQFNQKLSERRAEAVKSYLVSKEMSADQIETFGYGKTQPVPGVSCPDSLKRAQLIECLAPNRRVTVEVKGDPK